MLIKFLLHISPSTDVIFSSNKSRWQKLYVWLYRFLINRLAKNYKHFAYYDTITIDDVKIDQECRDYDFEQELMRINKNYKLLCTPKRVDYPCEQKRSGAHRFCSLFNWCSKLTITKNNNILVVKREGRSLSVDGSFMGEIMQFCNDGILEGIDYISSEKYSHKTTIASMGKDLQHNEAPINKIKNNTEKIHLQSELIRPIIDKEIDLPIQDADATTTQSDVVVNRPSVIIDEDF